MREAFTYMFKDNKFWIKGLCYLGLIFLSNLLTNYAQTLVPDCPKCAIATPWQYWVCIVVGAIVNLIPLGYMLTCMKALIDQDETCVLPYINPLKNLYKGFKYAIALLSMLIPLFVLTLIIIAIITGITSGSVYGLIISKILLISVIIGFTIIYTGFNWMFANKDTYLNFYNFKKVFEIIKSGKKHYFLSVGLICLMFVLSSVAELIFATTAGISLIPTLYGLVIVGVLAGITTTYITFVNCYLTAKSIKKEFIEML